jgi:hypothetical protein
MAIRTGVGHGHFPPDGLLLIKIAERAPRHPAPAPLPRQIAIVTTAIRY